MLIAVAQTNPTIGDIEGNGAQIAAAIERAVELKAKLVVLPELAIIGYPPKDLLLKPAVIQHCAEAVDALAAKCTDIAAIIGYPSRSEQSTGRTLRNAAAFCHGGRIRHCYAKSLLPSYDVFDETRYFEPAPADIASQPVDFNGLRIGLSICEDLWNDRHLVGRQLYHTDPVRALAQAGSQVIVNCSASPFVVDKHKFRLKLLMQAARRHQMPFVYCNQVGGNDELVFDGNSCVVGPDGRLIAHAKSFETDLLLAELPLGPGSSPADPNRLETPMDGMASVAQALVLGLGDYFRKCRFKSIVVGLSGGIDSAVTGGLCAAAVGSERVRGVAMPSRYSSDGSLTDARCLAKNLGITLHEVSIERAHTAIDQTLQPHFANLPADTTEENVQARIRGLILMAFSNKFGSLLVTTGNKSELAVGYCTLYGDMCGGMAVLSDVPKNMVWQLARWLNCGEASPLLKLYGRAVIPESSIDKPPSAELRPDQTDQDSLPPYELLDQIIERYVEHEQSASQIIAELPEANPATVLRIVQLIDLNEYKRKQAAPGIKITGRAFGFGRRMPIAQLNPSAKVEERMFADDRRRH